MKKLGVLFAGVLVAATLALPASAGGASCSASPSDVSLNSSYGISVASVPSGGLVYIWVTYQGGWKDGIGLRLDANGNGAVSLSTFSYPSTIGYAKVSVVRNDGHSNKIATCGFEVTT